MQIRGRITEIRLGKKVPDIRFALDLTEEDVAALVALRREVLTLTLELASPMGPLFDGTVNVTEGGRHPERILEQTT